MMIEKFREWKQKFFTSFFLEQSKKDETVKYVQIIRNLSSYFQMKSIKSRYEIKICYHHDFRPLYCHFSFTCYNGNSKRFHRHSHQLVSFRFNWFFYYYLHLCRHRTISKFPIFLSDYNSISKIISWAEEFIDFSHVVDDAEELTTEFKWTSTKILLAEEFRVY